MIKASTLKLTEDELKDLQVSDHKQPYHILFYLEMFFNYQLTIKVLAMYNTTVMLYIIISLREF